MSKLLKRKPEIRLLSEIKSVLYDQEWAKNAQNFEVYYVYRGIKKKNDLRYDITRIPGRMLGKEFVKTKGHEHLGKYEEIYIVLEGEAIYLLQKRRRGQIEDIYAVKAKKGDTVIIPPLYGHVAINPLKKELKMANWLSEKCQNNYKPFEKMGGAGYFYTKNGWIKNKNYVKTPKLNFKKPLKWK